MSSHTLTNQPSSILLKNGLLATFTKKDGVTTTPSAYRVDVLIQGDKITAIDESRRLSPPDDSLIIDCTDKWIAPGFVDTHRHVWMSIVDGHEDWTLTEYVAKLTFTAALHVTAEDVYSGELAGCLQALHGGTTTVVDHFHCANSAEHIEKAIQATAESGLRSMLCVSRQSLPSSFEPLRFDNDVQISEMQIQTLKTLAAKDNGRLTPDGRVTLGLAYDMQGLNPPEDKRIISLARELNITPITAHYVGGPHAKAYSKKAKMWKDAGLLAGDVIFSHGSDLGRKGCDEVEWELLRESGASIAATPEDELGMGHGDPVIYEAVRRGVKVGLGIDCASITSTEMFPAMRFALQHERGRVHKMTADEDKAPKYNEFTAASAFRLATLGGAEAAHVESKIGSIEVGKLADIVLYDANSVNLANVIDPFKGIVFHATAADVEWVIVNGEVVKKEGKLVRKEWSEVAKELKRCAGNVRERYKELDLDARYDSVIKQFGLETV
ncbi:Metallo-dependent hydrolase [Crucibulum laeve]|uniref:Metallo-dependent hydrolase n=1 Tax=Crucibulum laeve TaxID=68775 RepID=A0A5C3LKD0_9AGAR|nr:Metallo-dependent hydrolase [Crucibulum laeve]